MPTPDEEIRNALKANATGPARVSTEAGTVDQHDLRDQIEAARYLESRDAAARANRGLRFNRLVPPGAD